MHVFLFSMRDSFLHPGVFEYDLLAYHEWKTFHWILDYGLWIMDFFFFSFYISLDLICLIAFYEFDLLCFYYMSSRLTSYVNGWIELLPSVQWPWLWRPTHYFLMLTSEVFKVHRHWYSGNIFSSVLLLGSSYLGLIYLIPLSYFVFSYIWIYVLTYCALIDTLFLLNMSSWCYICMFL